MSDARKMTLEEATQNSGADAEALKRRVAYAKELIPLCGEDCACEIAYWRTIMELLNSEQNVEAGLMLRMRFSIPIKNIVGLVEVLHSAVNST